MTNNGVKELLLEQVHKSGGIFIDNITLTTEFVYSKSFLRKWAKENSVGKLCNMYYFNQYDIERLALSTNNFSKITKNINIFKKEKELERLRYDKEYLNCSIDNFLEESNYPENPIDNLENSAYTQTTTNFSIKDIEYKEYLSNLDVALLTGYTIPTINKWAKYYNLHKNKYGEYIWTQSDLKKFKRMKFWNKDSYHKHLDNVLGSNYWKKYWRTKNNESSKLSATWFVIIYVLVLLFCCTIGFNK